MRMAQSSILAAALLAASSLAAQAPQGPPRPGPEHQRLQYFAGRWQETGEMKAGPLGPGGPFTASVNCEWFTGNFHLVCRADGRGPTGPMVSLGIMGYSTETKRYTYYGIDNSGMGGDPAYGRVEGDTWTWEGEGLIGGQAVKGRYVMKVVSPDRYSWTWEMSVAGGPFTLFAEGTDTRVR